MSALKQVGVVKNSWGYSHVCINCMQQEVIGLEVGGKKMRK